MGSAFPKASGGAAGGSLGTFALSKSGAPLDALVDSQGEMIQSTLYTTNLLCEHGRNLLSTDYTDEKALKG